MGDMRSSYMASDRSFMPTGFTGSSDPFSLEGLLTSGLGMATGGLGGIIGTVGLQALTQSTGNTIQDASQGFLKDASKFADANLYNAAGRTGAATRASFDQKYNSLQNSAEAIQAANAQRQMAGRTLGAAQHTMDSAARTAERGLGAQTRAITDAASTAGSPAALAALANRLGDTTSQAIGQQAALQNQAAMGAAGQAAGMMSNSSDILNKDIANRYQTFVKPFEAQSSGLGNQMVSSLPGAMKGAQESRAFANPLAGFASGMGEYGGQMMNRPFNLENAKMAGDLFGFGRR